MDSAQTIARGIWHFSFTVSDIERSIRFYCDVLGLELVHRQEQANEYTRKLVGYPDAHLRIAQFKLPGAARDVSTHDLELVEYVTPKGSRGDVNICNPGAAHLAIAVDDVQAWYQRLTAAGVRFFSPPNAITAGINQGGLTCYFHDPDEIVLELVQPPPSRLAAIEFPHRRPFLLLEALWGDSEMAGIFSERRSVELWLRVEACLADAQASVGVMSLAEAEQVRVACEGANINWERLWHESSIVGYPILPLVRMVSAHVSGPGSDLVHFGATTQDIMDTALVLQLADACLRLDGLIARLGDAMSDLAERHKSTVMAARTHAQQAVPTTFGAKLATYMSEIARHRVRLREVQPRLRQVSLHGAAGTSAALGRQASEIRRVLAKNLGLGSTDVPWHVTRDSVAEIGFTCALISGTLARLAREVIDLSRTEIGEVREPTTHGRGASSTMPQKANPIASEAIIGMATTAAALTGGLHRAMEAGHERAAGEWQIEWSVLPQVVYLTSSCLVVAVGILSGLEVSEVAMRHNLDQHGDLLLAEAYAFRLGEVLGHRVAHDLVYDAAVMARATKASLRDTVLQITAEKFGGDVNVDLRIDPEDYVGSAREAVAAAISAWTSERAQPLVQPTEVI